MIIIAKVMVDNKLDAIVHKSVEHEPSLIKEGINPPYVTTRGVPTLNMFLIYAASVTVPSGFTSGNLPVGITFFGPPYSEPMMLRLAYSYEHATRHRVPPQTTPALTKGANRDKPIDAAAGVVNIRILWFVLCPNSSGDASSFNENDVRRARGHPARPKVLGPTYLE